MPDAPEVVKRPEDEAPTTSEPALTHAQVQALNRKMAARNTRWGGLRVKEAVFRCPWPCSRGVYEQHRKDAVERWIRRMARQGWELQSKVFVAPMDKWRTATAYSGDWATLPMLDQKEVPVAAVFRQTRMKRVRLEMPVRD